MAIHMFLEVDYMGLNFTYKLHRAWKNCNALDGESSACKFSGTVQLLKSSVVWDITFDTLTLNMKVTCSSETSVDFQRIARSYIPEDKALHNHRGENLRSVTFFSVVAKFWLWCYVLDQC